MSEPIEETKQWLNDNIDELIDIIDNNIYTNPNNQPRKIKNEDIEQDLQRKGWLPMNALEKFENIGAKEWCCDECNRIYELGKTAIKQLQDEIKELKNSIKDIKNER